VENLHTIPEDLLVKHLLQEASLEEAGQVEAWIERVRQPEIL